MSCRSSPPDASYFAHQFGIANPGLPGQTPVACRIAGVIANSPFDVGQTGGRNLFYASRELIEKLTRPEDRRTVVDVALKDRMDAEKVAGRVRATWGFDNVQTWMDANASALPFINGIRIAAYSGMAAIACLAIIGVGVAIVMTIEDRRRQLAILYAMGMDATELRFIFLLAGVKLVVVSSILGLLLAYGLATLSLPFWKNLVENFFHSYRAELVYSFPALVLMVALAALVAMAASWLASRAVTASDPITSLR